MAPAVLECPRLLTNAPFAASLLQAQDEPQGASQPKQTRHSARRTTEKRGLLRSWSKAPLCVPAFHYRWKQSTAGRAYGLSDVEEACRLRSGNTMLLPRPWRVKA